jgi:hypothetical protein
MSGDIESSFPMTVSVFKRHKKLFFSYRTQTFATYEKGQLIMDLLIWGVKNTKLNRAFLTNWKKAEQTTSTFDDEWDLRWNFNVENKLGRWHNTLSGLAFLFKTSGGGCNI